MRCFFENKNRRAYQLAFTVFFGVTLFIFGVFFVRCYNIEGNYSIALGNPRDSYVVVKTNEILKRHIPSLKEASFAGEYEKIGWVTDIHADRFKRRTVQSGTIYPRQYLDYLPKVFDAMRARGVDTVIATGDNANSGDDNYGRALERIAEEKHMRVLWAMGNHDSDASMIPLGIGGDKYYFFDYGNTRIVVLDDALVTRETGDYEGGFDEEQLRWLQTALKTERNVIIAMHVPIFHEQGAWMNAILATENQSIATMASPVFELPQDTIVLERYNEFENILRENGNVTMVFTGHWHLPWKKEYNGISYYGEAALTHEKFKGAYGIVDLQNNSVEYLFAQ